MQLKLQITQNLLRLFCEIWNFYEFLTQKVRKYYYFRKWWKLKCNKLKLIISKLLPQAFCCFGVNFSVLHIAFFSINPPFLIYQHNQIKHKEKCPSGKNQVSVFKPLQEESLENLNLTKLCIVYNREKPSCHNLSCKR